MIGKTKPPLPVKPQLIPLAVKVWQHPRAVIREVVDFDPWFGQIDIILALALASGLLALPMGVGMMALETILNLLLTVITLYPMAGLLWLAGWMMGGQGNFAELSASMVWPMSPAIVGTLVAYPLLNFQPGGFPVADIVQGLFYLFSFHLMVQTVAEVQQFGAWKSFWSQMIALVISLLPFLIFWNQIVGAFKPMIGF